MSTPTIVLLHGASGNAATWGPTLAAWGEAPVLALDLPGRGEAPRQPASTAAEAATWLMGELARRGLHDVVLLGHSYGGAVALEAALAAPDALSGVVLVASSSRLRVAPPILEAVAASASGVPFVLDFAFGPGTTRAVMDRYSQDAASTPPAACLADWQACDAFDVRARLGEVRVPVLVVHGDQDALTPGRFQARLAEALPGSTRVELAGVGHMLPWEAPEALAQAVLGWIGSEEVADTL